MKVKFANAEVDIWKLRKGVVLEFASEIVHLSGVVNHDKGIAIMLSYWDHAEKMCEPSYVTWLEPHD
jgi:hypothetical protein